MSPRKSKSQPTTTTTPAEPTEQQVVLLTRFAGPLGNAEAGTVVTLPIREAQQLIAAGAARLYNHAKDHQLPKGLAKGSEAGRAWKRRDLPTY